MAQDDAGTLISLLAACMAERIASCDVTITNIQLSEVIQEGENHLAALPDAVGVYAFMNRNSVAGDFLYIGESHAQGVRTRVGQHLRPRDSGGNFRQHWCSYHCEDDACGEKEACSGEAFQEFEKCLHESGEV